MELGAFVKSILIDLDKAVEEANSEMGREVRFADNQDKRTVEFDIAVTVDEKTGGKAGGNVKVLGLFDAGSDIKKEKSFNSVSRLQFGLHVSRQTKQEEGNFQLAVENVKEYDPYD